MAYTFDNKRDETYMDGPISSATTNLFRVLGGWGNISGPSIFMLRSLLAGSSSAVAFGISGATICAIIFGTAAIPFIVFSSMGFVIGSVGFYRDCMSKALLNLDLHPRLLQLHLDANFPSMAFRRMQLSNLRAVEFSKNWTLKSMLLVSWLTAQPALDQIMEAKERMLVDEAIERMKDEDNGRMNEDGNEES